MACMMEGRADQFVGKKPPLLLSCRALVSILIFFGYTNMYLQRVGLSVAIVCMVNHTALRVLASGDNSSAVKFSDCSIHWNTSQDMEDGEFLWSKTVQGFILGSFFGGYIALQIFGSLLASSFGSKTVMAVQMLITSFAMILTPEAARVHFGALIVIRVIIGLCSGIAFPVTYITFSYWVPPSEQHRLIGAAMAGPALGTFLSMVLGGLLCRFGFAGGWPSVFYIFGGLGLMWCFLWIIFVSDEPSGNRWISTREKDYIKWSLKDAMKRAKRDQVPWRSILTSRPVWAMFITHTLCNCAEYLFITQLPTYLREVAGYNITDNGYLSALPWIASLVVTLMASHLADSLVARKIFSRNICRKLFQTFSQLPLIIFMVAITFLSCSERNVAAAFMMISITFTGLNQGAGHMLNPTDLAPQYSSIIFAISNTIATIPGILVPPIVGVMTPQRSRHQWNNVFYITAAISALSCLNFILFGSAELQDWAKPRETELCMDKKEEEKEEEALV